MRRPTFLDLAPALLVAAGILGATALASAAATWPGAIASLLVLVLAVGAASRIRRPGEPPALPAPALALLAVVIFAAGVISVLADPARLAPTLPLLGTIAIPFLVAPRRSASTCRRA